MTQDAEVDDLVASALSDTDLRKLLGDIQSERVVIMIDACYAAATVNGAADAPKGVNDLLARFTGKGRAILSAAGDGEEALEAASLKHSVFTYFLLEGLKGQADANQDGVVVLPELTTYLDDHVADEARKRKGIQKPFVNIDAQEPAKFRLVIDPVRLSAITAAAVNRQAIFDRRMAKVRELLVDDKLTDEQAKEAKTLFAADPAKLSKDDLLVLAEYVNVVEGKLAPDKLAKVIGLIRSTPTAVTSTPATTTPSTPTVTTNASWIGTKAGDVREDNSLKLKLIWCPPGKFTMGSPKSETDRSEVEDQVSVTLTQGFWLGKFEVTQTEYQQVVGSNPSYFSAQGEGKSNVSGLATGRFPVETVSCDEAQEFCKKLTSQERAAGRLPAGWRYDLPTEAQWEYACRAGTITATAFGDRLSSADANFDGNYPYNGAAKGPDVGRPKDVGSYKPNAWGLCDMHGNVWEWCRDYYAAMLPGGTDPDVTVQASSRVIRGGCWYDGGRYCPSAYRIRHDPGNRDRFLGFRVAAVPGSK